MHRLCRRRILVVVVLAAMLTAENTLAVVGRINTTGRSIAAQEPTAAPLVDDQSIIFQDDFENDSFEDWTIVTSLIVQEQLVANGNSAVRATRSNSTF
jgi:hypothetical protein